MDHERIDDPDSLEIRILKDEAYRTCSVCARDCDPVTEAIDGIGVRVLFACREHGAQSVLDPFSDLR